MATFGMTTYPSGLDALVKHEVCCKWPANSSPQRLVKGFRGDDLGNTRELVFVCTSRRWVAGRSCLALWGEASLSRRCRCHLRCLNPGDPPKNIRGRSRLGHST